MKPFYIETGMGACIRMARTAESAEAAVLREVGTIHGVSLVREAKTADALFIKSMGGYVPPEAEKYLARQAKENHDAST
jgi:hypothetical protein